MGCWSEGKLSKFVHQDGGQIKEKGRITNKEYQEINEIAERTASRDLADLVSREIVINSGLKGAGAFYTLASSITP